MTGLRGVLESSTLTPDLARAVRACVAFTVPLVVGQALGHPTDALFISLTAQLVALQDLRGAYPVRLGVLGAMMFVTAVSGFLGVLAGENVILAVLGMGLIALLNGCWRHLSTDYGPGLSVASTLVFLLGLSHIGGIHEAAHLAFVTAMGAAWASLLHAGFWMIRGQHPLRYCVAETWVAASDLAMAMRGGPTTGAELLTGSVITAEVELRAALDRTFKILGAAESERNKSLVQHLEEMRRQVVHFTVSTTALHAAMGRAESPAPRKRYLETADAVLEALSNMARSTALALLMHREKNIAACELRINRAENLLAILRDEVIEANLPPLDVDAFRTAIMQVENVLARTQDVMARTVHREVSRAEIPAPLADLTGRGISDLAGWMNPESNWSPALIRHTTRSVVLTMFAVGVYKGFSIPYGYWIAFTIVVVLQTDFGATRKRAMERVGGTLAGSLLGSILIGVRLPLPVADILSAANSFAFAYLLRRKYAFAVFFVTLLVILTTETIGPIQADFPIARFLSNAAGGILALIAAWIFWPTSEREQLPSALATSLRANRDFALALARWFADPEAEEREILHPRRQAEHANGLAATSADRFAGEMGNPTGETERAALVAAYSRRLTRALTVLAGAVHLPERKVFTATDLPLSDLANVIGIIADNIEAHEEIDATALAERVSSFTDRPGTIDTSQDAVWHSHFARCALELRALIVALDSAITSHAAEPAPLA